MSDPFNLQRFISAQESKYSMALGELKAGYKSSHWMWYIFPQVSGLGQSSASVLYSISGLPEARAYFEHPILGARLLECCQALSGLAGNSPEAVFGGIDAMKFRSSLTLFYQATGSSIFKDLLQKYYGGAEDQATLELLGEHS